MAGKNEVELGAKANFENLWQVFRKLGGEGRKVGDELSKAGKGMGDDMANMTKNTETFLGRVGNLARRTADQMKDDFKALASINAVAGALKLSEQFKGTITDTVNLSDTIRKLGRTFGLTGEDFSKFQSKLTKGLGDIGLSSEVANETLKGLAETPVRNQDSVLEYAKQSGELASISQQKGSEGDIAKGIARVLEAKGVNPNNQGAVKNVAEDLRRVFNQTGKGPKETVKVMEELFTSMAKDMRGKISTRGLANLAAVAQISGPNSTKFLEEFLSKSPIQRQAIEAQGFKGVFGDKGLDIKKFHEASQGIISRVGGDPRLAAKTLGMSDEAAEGFVRLNAKLEEAEKAQDAINSSTGNLSEQYKSSMGAVEAFKASLNKVKGVIAGPLSQATQKFTDVLSKASGSTAGAVGVIGGGSVLAALLAGGGLRGIFKHAKGAAQDKAMETVGGKEVIPVRVVNADEIGGGGGTPKDVEKLGKFGKVLAGIGAFETGMQIGNVVNSQILEKHTQGKTDEGFEGNAMERFFFKLDQMVGGSASKQFNQNMRVVIENNDPRVKATPKPTRGKAY